MLLPKPPLTTPFRPMLRYQEQQQVPLGRSGQASRNSGNLVTPLSSLRLSALATTLANHLARLSRSVSQSRNQSRSRSESRNNSISTKSSSTKKFPVSKTEKEQPTPKPDTFKSEFSLDDYINELNEATKDAEIKLQSPEIKFDNNGAEKPHDVDQIKLAKHLTSIFLDTRRSLRADLNIVDPTEAPGQNDKFNFNVFGGEPVHPTIEISRSTLIRAKKVETNIALKYMYIQRLYDWSQLNADKNYHPGVEGVFNPIQILRNRKIRAKYHEYPKQLLAKTLPLPCNVFSSKNINPKKPWKMLWAIELNEFINDISWRTNHWHELRKPNGDCWFPNESLGPSLSYKEKKKRRVLRRKLHDKIFNDHGSDSDSSTDIDSASKIKIKSISKHTGASVKSSESENYHLFRVSKSKSPTRKKLRRRVKDRAKKMYKHHNDSSSSSWFSDEESVATDSGVEEVNENEKILKEKMFETIQSQSQEIFNSNNGSKELIDDDSKNSATNSNSNSILKTNDNSTNNSTSSKVDISATPVIKIEDDSTPTNLNLFKVPIKPVESKRPSADATESIDPLAKDPLEPNETEPVVDEETSDTAVPEVTDEIKKIDDTEITMNEISKRLQFIDNILYLRINYLINIYPQLMNTLDTKLNHILYEQVPEIGRSTVRINDDVLPAYEVLYHGFLNEIKSLVHVVNDVYAVRIDNLLSNSDRSIGEINTSLSLELRKVNEKLDKLNTSLFSNIVTEKLKESELSLKLKNSDNNQILYYFLENTIVVLLRVIWIVVNIYKFFMLIIMFFWKIIRFFFKLL